MALKARIANKVQANATGQIEGTLINVLEIDERFEDSKGNVICEEEFQELKKLGKKVNYFGQQFEFQIEAIGSQKNIIYRIWTRQTFNNEKYEKADKATDYNDFTRLMLQLQVISEADLKDLDSLVNFDVECVQGLKIAFELEPSKKANGLSQPKLTSIKPIKVK